MDLFSKIEIYEVECLEKLAKIRKLPNGKYRVLSEKGKNLGTYTSKDSAKKRLSQIEYFKHLDKSHADDQFLDLTDIDEFAYSAIMRKLNQKASKEQVKDFLILYKKEFDRAVKKKLTKPDKIALQETVLKFNKIHPIKFNNKVIKLAAVAELGNPAQVGSYLSEIVKFIVTQRLPSNKQPKALQILKQKFATMSENEIVGKNLPDVAAYGQAITFVKHVLFNHDASYIRDVLNTLSRDL